MWMKGRVAQRSWTPIKPLSRVKNNLTMGRKPKLPREGKSELGEEDEVRYKG